MVTRRDKKKRKRIMIGRVEDSRYGEESEGREVKIIILCTGGKQTIYVWLYSLNLL
jgi:hypothetical protein